MINISRTNNGKSIISNNRNQFYFGVLLFHQLQIIHNQKIFFLYYSCANLKFRRLFSFSSHVGHVERKHFWSSHRQSKISTCFYFFLSRHFLFRKLISFFNVIRKRNLIPCFFMLLY